MVAMLGMASGPSHAQPGRVGVVPVGQAVSDKDSSLQDARNKRGADLRLALTPSKGQAGNPSGNGANAGGAPGAHNSKFRQEVEPDAKSGLMNAGDSSPTQSGNQPNATLQPKVAPQFEPKFERHLSAREREEMREQLRQQRVKR